MWLEAAKEMWVSDLYDALVAPTLKVPLLVESWQNGASAIVLPSNCSVQYEVNAGFSFKSSLIIIIIITFKGAIRDFLQSPHSAANCLQHARSSGPGAIVCKSRATHRALITCKCHVTCHLVRRDSSAIKFDRVEIAFIWALFCWLNH